MNHNMQMQKETGKILHRKFLSENIGLLLMAPVFLLLMFIVSNLYQLPAEYAFYLTSIFLILWVTTLCMQYRGFRKRTEQYEKESKEKQESNSKESRQWEELQEKQDFFALWAHQIKTPIAALNLLLQGEKQNVAACRQELFKIESYVEMALNYLRFEEMSNDLVLERNSLEQLVRQVVKKYAAIFIYNHISLIIAYPFADEYTRSSISRDSFEDSRTPRRTDLAVFHTINQRDQLIVREREVQRTFPREILCFNRCTV